MKLEFGIHTVVMKIIIALPKFLKRLFAVSMYLTGVVLHIQLRQHVIAGLAGPNLNSKKQWIWGLLIFSSLICVAVRKQNQYSWYWYVNWNLSTLLREFSGSSLFCLGLRHIKWDARFSYACRERDFCILCMYQSIEIAYSCFCQAECESPLPDRSFGRDQMIPYVRRVKHNIRDTLLRYFSGLKTTE